MGRRKSVDSSASSGSDSDSGGEHSKHIHLKKEKKDKDKKKEKDSKGKDKDDGHKSDKEKKEKKDKSKDEGHKSDKEKKDKKDKSKDDGHKSDKEKKDKDKKGKGKDDGHKSDKEKKSKDEKDKSGKDKKEKDKKEKDKGKGKDEDEKKDKDKAKERGDAPDHKVNLPHIPAFPSAPPSSAANPLAPPMSFGFDDHNANFRPHDAHGLGPAPGQRAPQGQGAPPPSGFRIPLSTDTPFPSGDQTGWPPLYDADGSSPIFIGSALFQNSVHPCKLGPHLKPAASVAYGGAEHAHQGRYDLLPFIPEQMEWVATSHGRVPAGRRPIEGGYEENGAKLYHGLGVVDGVRVPGKAGEHLRGCNVSFGGREIAVEQHEILCWK